jgi:aminopeptidase N
MLDGEVTPLETINVFINSLRREKNELMLNYITGRVNTIFWNFLNKEERERIGATLDKWISTELIKENSKGVKKTLYNLMIKVANNPRGIQVLFNIWSKKVNHINQFLNENDYINLAMQLVIFNHPKATEILEQQQARISNPDRLERFKWLMPSLSNDEKVRDGFMKSLLQKENREKESWVQAALGNIHHPLRQKSSAKHLKSILDKLEEVQLTGDIFFPKGWLASSIGNYSSKEANDILNQFLEDNPDYSPILLKKLHQTTDNLTRAQNIKK